MIKDKKFIIIGILIAIVLIFAIICAFSFSVFYFKSDFGKGVVKINGKSIKVETALTAETQYQGLQGRNSLPADQGMLFVFKDKRYHEFWMQGMKFPIDIIWINDSKIIEITKNAPVPTNSNSPAIFTPPSEVNYVLEVNAGYTEKNNIKIGDTVEINLK